MQVAPTKWHHASQPWDQDCGGNERNLEKQTSFQSLLLLSALLLLYHCTPWVSSDLIKPKNAPREGSWQQSLWHRGHGAPLQPHTQLWAGVCTKTPSQTYSMPTSEHAGLICTPSYKRRQPADAAENAKAHHLVLAAQIFPQNTAAMAWSPPQCFSSCPWTLRMSCRCLELLATWKVWCAGREARQAGHPAAALSCVIVQLLTLQQSSNGGFIKQLQIYNSRWNDKTFQ